MRITKAVTVVNGEKVKLSSTIFFKNGKKDIVYLETNACFKEYLTDDSSAFLALLLFSAMFHGEDIIIEGTVSKKLYKNVKKIMRVMIGWNCGFQEVKIQIDGYTPVMKKQTKAGLFFSGGVDSFYTLMKHKKTVSNLIFVHGMDIRLHEQLLYDRIFKSISHIASHEKTVLIPVKTNAREMLDRLLPWKFAHGSVLMFIALSLSRGFTKIFVSSGMHITALRPYGTHPMLDHLWSIEKTTIIHFGHLIDRLAKITFLSRTGFAIDNLRVCWMNTKSSFNCGKCEKCLRTMISLYTCGVLHKSKTFPQTIDTTVLSRLYIDEKNHYRYFKENLLALKSKKAPEEIIKALEVCLLKNYQSVPLLSLYRKFRSLIATLDTKYCNSYLFLKLQKR